MSRPKLVYVSRSGPPVFDRLARKTILPVLGAAIAVLSAAWFLGVLLWALSR